jgi:prepilin-type N-terminal cleavage/methylation domain-containing protein
MRRPDPARVGFTLLEVLAAVAVLGILYVVLADVAIQGLRAEGRSRLRLEASLVADRRLSDLEIAIEAGGVPEFGATEDEEDLFRVATEVRPFAIPLPPGIDADRAAPGEALASLREIELTVTWLEGEDEQSVRRTTYAFDRAAVAEQLGGAGPTGERGGERGL